MGEHSQIYVSPGVLSGAADWRADDLVRASQWTRRFADEEITEIERALDGLRREGIHDLAFSREQFDLPILSRALPAIASEIEDGFGIFRLRGFPVARHGEAQLRQLVWGLGLHLGTARPQDEFDTLLADVRDVEGRRGYENSDYLNFHSDPADVTALFCLGAPAEGGLSLIASSLAIHNAIARHRPDLLAELYRPMVWSWAGRQRAGEKSWCEVPIFGVGSEGGFASIYSRMRFIVEGQAGRAPVLSALQREALDLIAAYLADPDFVARFAFEPGDLQLINNYVIYHGRTSFRDNPAGRRQRHLLRLWLSVPGSRPLPPGFEVILKDRRAGALRGGYARPD